MNKYFLENLLICPRCKTSLLLQRAHVKCPKCKREYYKKNGIWHLLYLTNQKTKISQKEYDLMHQEKFDGPNDGSYEILASIARGGKTVDIACGNGQIEKLAPETVGVEFSLAALKKAKKNGAKYLVLADAHSLPFKNNSFDVAICAGSLEHFENPQAAIKEMARVSKIQVLTVHTYPPIPFATLLFNLVTLILRIRNQPIEKPISPAELEKMLKKAQLHIVFKGVWTLPLNYGRVIKFLPQFDSIPSSLFVITIKK